MKTKFFRFNLKENILFGITDANNSLIGYVAKSWNNGEEWFWFRGNEISNGFSNMQDAADDLVEVAVHYNMDEIAKKIGTYNDERFTKGR